MSLSQEGKNNIRALRGWAKSKGWEKLPNPRGRPEQWVSKTADGQQFNNLVIKPSGSFQGDLVLGSGIPRFSCRIGKGNHFNPFTAEKLTASAGQHIPLDKRYW